MKTLEAAKAMLTAANTILPPIIAEMESGVLTGEAADDALELARHNVSQAARDVLRGTEGLDSYCASEVVERLAW